VEDAGSILINNETWKTLTYPDSWLDDTDGWDGDAALSTYVEWFTRAANIAHRYYRGIRGSTAFGDPGTADRRVERSGDEYIQDDGSQQRGGVEDDQVCRVVDDVEIFVVGQRQRAYRDVAAVVETRRLRGGQRQPRTAVGDAGRPETENDASSSTHRVECLGAQWATDCDVPEPCNRKKTGQLKLYTLAYTNTNTNPNTNPNPNVHKT